MDVRKKPLIVMQVAYAALTYVALNWQVCARTTVTEKATTGSPLDVAVYELTTFRHGEKCIEQETENSSRGSCSVITRHAQLHEGEMKATGRIEVRCPRRCFWPV